MRRQGISLKTVQKAMVDDGLYDKVPKPGEIRLVLRLTQLLKPLTTFVDIVLGAHVFPMRAGVIGSKRGVTMSAADSFQLVSL